MKNKREGVTLKEYLVKYGTPITTLAYRSGLTFHKVYGVLRGGCPTLKTALSIERYTKGEVTCKSLLPDKLWEEVENNKYEQEKAKEAE